MADESFELEDGEVVPSAVTGPSSSSSAAAADVLLRAQLHEAATVLRQRGQPDLARLALGLVDAYLRDAMWVLDDQVRGGDFSGDPALFDAFRHKILMHLFSLRQEAGYDEDVISDVFPHLVLEAAEHAARLIVQTYDGIDGQLEKQTFIRAAAAAGGNDDDGGCGVTECSICCEEFVDGGEVAVMPCPSRVHKFHPVCISKWLAISKMCPPPSTATACLL